MNIIPHESQADEMAQRVDKLLDGWRWCTVCNDVVIAPDMASYAFKCKSCYALWKRTEGRGEPKIVQAEGYKPSSVAPNRKRIVLSSEGLSKFCTKCGDEIDENRLHFTMFISAGKRELSKCMACAKGYKEALNDESPKCKQIFVPNGWIQFRDKIYFPTQMSLI